MTGVKDPALSEADQISKPKYFDASCGSKTDFRFLILISGRRHAPAGGFDIGWPRSHPYAAFRALRFPARTAENFDLRSGKGLNYPSFTQGGFCEPGATICADKRERWLLSADSRKAIWRELPAMMTRRAFDRDERLAPYAIQRFGDDRRVDLWVGGRMGGRDQEGAFGLSAVIG